MNNTPIYKKWFNGFSAEVASVSETQTVTPGQILVSGSDNKSKNPPTNGESYNMSEIVFIPQHIDEERMPTPMVANLRIAYMVEDWGYVTLDGERLINLTTAAENPTGAYGGHSAWSAACSAVIMSGVHQLDFAYTNITMPDPNMNRIVCEYVFRAVQLEPGGKKESQECPCLGSTCSLEGGQNPPISRSASNNSFDSSSAGTSVIYDMTDDSMVWSCNMGVLRGLGANLSGKVQLYTDSFDSALASPSALFYNHPMLTKLVIPAGGAVPGAKLEIHMGDRVIAFRYYLDGSIAPIGVDSAGNGMASLTLDANDTVTSLKWQDNSGAAWVFDGVTGELLSYTSPEMLVVDNVSDYLVVKKSADETYIRQVWGLWDGLMNIEEVTTSGYKIRLYAPSKITGIGADGYYTVTSSNDAFKCFTVTHTETGLTVLETTPGREAYSCTWSKATDGAWSMVKGSGDEAVSTTRVRSVIEPASAGSFEVWQLVTTVSKGNVVASCVCEVYQNSPMGEFAALARGGLRLSCSTNHYL